MFTINIYLKFALIALGLIGGIIMSATMGFWYGFPFILIGLGLLISYFLLGTVASAGQLLQTQDFNAAEKSTMENPVCSQMTITIRKRLFQDSF